MKSLRRFIPACAGNAGQPIIQLQDAAGSSPHARGTQELPLDEGRGARFIPACAGNAGSTLFSSSHMAVHPRMRGERERSVAPMAFSAGSSPHARGTLSDGYGVEVLGRFIPACAGNAWRGPEGLICRAVHPRMRGERQAMSSIFEAAGGSSPHARGTRQERPLSA